MIDPDVQPIASKAERGEWPPAAWAEGTTAQRNIYHGYRMGLAAAQAITEDLPEKPRPIMIVRAVDEWMPFTDQMIQHSGRPVSTVFGAYDVDDTARQEGFVKYANNVCAQVVEGRDIYLTQASLTTRLGSMVVARVQTLNEAARRAEPPRSEINLLSLSDMFSIVGETHALVPGPNAVPNESIA